MPDDKNSNNSDHWEDPNGTDISKLDQLVKSLSQTPPSNRKELKERYSQITRLITKIEAEKGKGRKRAHGMISRIEPEFTRVHDTYTPLTRSTLKQDNNSLLVDEYRFFVSGLEIYRNRLAEWYANAG